MKQVSNAISGAVCVGGELGVSEFLPHFQHRSADVIEIDIGTVGITGALQIADAAFGYELPVTLTATAGNIHAHLAGVMPNFMSLEVLDPASRVRSQLVESTYGSRLAWRTRRRRARKLDWSIRMKITGYRVEQYLMKMDRLVGDANLPSGVEMLPGSILYLETDEDVTGISLGYGGGDREPVRRDRGRGSARGRRPVDHG